MTVVADEAAGRFYRRAEELRTIASCTKDPACRAAMIDWANDYEHMAQRTIEQSNILHQNGQSGRHRD